MPSYATHEATCTPQPPEGIELDATVFVSKLLKQGGLSKGTCVLRIV